MANELRIRLLDVYSTLSSSLWVITLIPEDGGNPVVLRLQVPKG